MADSVKATVLISSLFQLKSAVSPQSIFLKNMSTLAPQLKDLVWRSLTFVRDDIVIAGRSEECRTTQVSSRPKGEISFLEAEFW